MHYWFRPAVHLCESSDADQAICGVAVTGLSPTVRPLPDDAVPVEYFADRDVEVCDNCRRINEARRD